MIVVSDTTPLISLLKVGRINLLEKLFGQVLIPQAVYQELSIDKRFEKEAELIANSPFILVKSVRNPESVSVLKRATGLDQGESEAIILTDETNADILLMDEAKGRSISGEMGIKVMGTIGILMASYQERELSSDEAKECIDILQSTGRHISQKHYQMLLAMLEK